MYDYASFTPCRKLVADMGKTWILFSAAVFMAAACSEKEPVAGSGNGENNVEGQYEASFKVESSVLAFRSPLLDGNGAGNFSDGDRNTLFFSDAKGSLKTAVQYTCGSSCLWSDLGLDDMEEVSVTACWPELSASDKDGLMSEAASYVWNSMKDNGKSDFLLSDPVKATAGKTENIRLAFSHRLHKFAVELSAAEGEDISSGELASAEIRLEGVLPEVPVTLATSSLGSARGIPSGFSETGTKAWFIIPPQPSGEMTVSVLFADKTFTVKVAGCNVAGKPVENLESGKVFTLKIAVSREKAFTVTGQAISGWESQGSADGTIEI